MSNMTLSNFCIDGFSIKIDPHRVEDSLCGKPRSHSFALVRPPLNPAFECRSEQEAGDASPTESAVFWECQLATSLVKLVSSTLGAINWVLSGQGLPSQGALASAKALLGNSIPQAWDRLWEVRL
jgi:hypothetical protein